MTSALRSIQAKMLMLSLGIGVALLLLVTLGVLGMRGISRLANRTRLELLPIIACVYRAEFALQQGGDIRDRALLDVDRPEAFDEVRKYESQFQRTMIEFDMYMKALVWGSESETFKQIAGGLTSAEWVRGGLQGKLIVPQAPDAIRRLATEAELHYAGFSNNTMRVMKRHKHALRAALLPQAEGAAALQQDTRTSREASERYASFTHDLLTRIDAEVDVYIDEVVASIADAQRATDRLLVVGSAVVLLLTMGFCLVFSNVVVIQPVRLLAQGSQAIGRGAFETRVSIPSDDELGQLARAFNDMARKVQESHELLEMRVRQRTEELSAANAAFAKSNRELDDFTYIVSHDLKEPLRSLDAFSKFLADEYYEQLGEEGRGYLERVRANAKRMQDLIEDLLEVSRLSRRPNELQVVNVNELLADVKLRFEYVIAEKHVHILVKEQLPTMSCDRVRLTEVFANLISNAIKYNDKPECRIEISCRTTDGYYQFSVKDNGPGIEPQYFEKIFEIFQRLGRKEEHEGTGVGLTIVKKVIGLHKGKIWVESAVGDGTTFHFTIPTDESVIRGKPKLGEILVKKGAITEAELGRALEEQERGDATAS